jgi:hypothetical protein
MACYQRKPRPYPGHRPRPTPDRSHVRQQPIHGNHSHGAHWGLRGARDSNEVPDSIIAHAPIVDQGHSIIETKTETIIRDVGEQYELCYPKAYNANEWTLPWTPSSNYPNTGTATQCPPTARKK